MSTDRDAPLLLRLAGTKIRPVFILGLHRSGTTILYRILADAGRFNKVTAYHLVCYDELLHNHEHGLTDAAREALTRRLDASGQTDRGIDRVKASADAEEEYGFHLLRQSGKRNLTPQNLHCFRELAQKVQYVADNDRPLLVKNPYDLSTFLLAPGAFPEARFVFIHRHPLRTLTSSLNAVRSLLAKRNAYTALLSAPYRELFQSRLALGLSRAAVNEWNPLSPLLLALGAAHQVRYYLASRDQLPAGIVQELKYEDLCQDPVGTIERLLRGLDMEPEDATDASLFVQPRELPLDPGVSRLRGVIHRLMRPYYDRFGYGLNPP